MPQRPPRHGRRTGFRGVQEDGTPLRIYESSHVSQRVRNDAAQEIQPPTASNPLTGVPLNREALRAQQPGGPFGDQAFVLPKAVADRIVDELWRFADFRLPDQQHIPWHRKRTVRPPQTAGQVVSVNLDRTPNNSARLIYAFVQYWLERGHDPVDPNVVMAMQDHQATYGRLRMSIGVRDNAVINARETVIDPGINAAADRTEEYGGVTVLNRNILNMAGAPMVIYVPDNTRLTVSWTLTPAGFPVLHVPTLLGAEAQGHAVPRNVINQIARHLKVK